MRIASITSPITLALICLSVFGLEAQSRVEAVRFWSFGDVTRVAIQTAGDYKLASDQIDRPPRAYFDLSGLRPPPTAHRGIQTITVGDRLVKQIRIAEVSPGKTRIVFDLEAPVELISSQLVNPDRLMIEIRPKGTSLPALSVAHSVTGSQRVDLSSDGSGDESVGSQPPDRTSSPDTRTSVSAAARNASSPASGSTYTSPRSTYPPSSRAAIPSSSSTRTTTIQRPDGFVVQQVTSSVTPPVASPIASNSIATTTISPSPVPRPTIPPPAPTSSSSSKVVGVAAPAKTDSAGDRSLVRVFGLKLGKVVIDAGHGGHDTGTIGPNGLMEKDLVLDVALRLGKLITQQLGAEVVYTRSDDTFIPLETRTKIANDERADLFISIHANSSPEPSATGVETYFFNLTSDKSGLDLATRENATSASSIADLNDLLHRAVLQTKLEESREFAQRVQSCLWATSLKMNSRSRDRGVRQAPFVVLIGATMPSVLAEIGFVSNPHDERFLSRPDERQRIADALFKGVSQYASSLSHVQMAKAGSE